MYKIIAALESYEVAMILNVNSPVILKYPIFLPRILFVCHGLLYKQLCSWLLYGCLNDPYQEFFVQVNSEDSGNVSTLPPQEEEDDELPILGVTGRQLQVGYLYIYMFLPMEFWYLVVFLI